jgi:hypothetical protein
LIYKVKSPGEDLIYLFPKGMEALADMLGYQLLVIAEDGLYGWKLGTTEWVGIPTEDSNEVLLKLIPKGRS